MKRITNREQVLHAIADAGSPQTAAMIYAKCDCFADQKDCAALLATMVKAKEIVGARLIGEAWMRFGTAEMKFVQASAVARVAPVPEIETEPLERATRPYHRGAPAKRGNPAREKMGMANRVRIVEALQTQATSTSAPCIAKILRLSPATVSVHFLALEAEGRLTRFGTGTKSRFALTGSAAAAAAEAALEADATRPSKPAAMSAAYDAGRRIVQALERAEMPLSRAMLCEALGVSGNTITSHIQPLIASGEVVRIGLSNHCTFGLPGMAPARADRAAQVLQAVTAAGKPVSTAEIGEAIGAHKRHVWAVIKKLADDGQVKVHGAGRFTLYTLPDAPGPGLDGARAAVLDILTNAPAPLAPREICAALDIAHAHCSRILTEFHTAGQIERLGHGNRITYQLKPEREKPRSHLLAKVESTFGTDPADDHEPLIRQQLRGVASIPRLDIDAIHARSGLTAGAASEISQTFNLLRQHLSEDEFKGYLRGNLITLSLRGQPEDLARLQVFGQALAGVV